MTNEELRVEVRRRLNACPTCGRGVSSADAEAIGLPYHTLRRFLKGEPVAPDATERVIAWLQTRMRAES